MLPVPPKVTPSQPQPSGAPTRPLETDRGTMRREPKKLSPAVLRRMDEKRARNGALLAARSGTATKLAREPAASQGGFLRGRTSASVERTGSRATSADAWGDEDGDEDLGTPRGPLVPPAFNDGRVTFPKPGTDAWFALAHPPPLKGPRRAPMPEPGYRYRMDGVLVPLIDPRLSLDGREGQAVFLEILEYTGSQRAAMDAVGVCSARTVEKVLEKDEAFLEAYQAAINRHRDSIYMAAYERSVHGTLKPVVGGRNKDQIITYERVYSDGLTQLLLKRHFQEFRDADKGTSVSVTTNVANVLPREVGQKIRSMTREQRDAMRLVLAPRAESQVQAEDAEIVEKEQEP